MHAINFFNFLFLAFVALAGCSSVPRNQDLTCIASGEVERNPAQVISNHVLVPQEIYGDEVLAALDRVNEKTSAINILHFNFFTDNPGDTYPKRIANKLVEIRKRFPGIPIHVLLEGKKDLGTKGGAAERNKVTKGWLQERGIEVFDINGRNPPLSGRELGVSHTKLVQIGNEVIAGSTNLTKQSTDPSANNEMNLRIDSAAIAQKVTEYVEAVRTNPNQLVQLTAVDGDLRLLTDDLHFDALKELISSSQKGDALNLSMYQFLYRDERDAQAKEILDQLISAHQRGVAIEIFLNKAQDLATQNTEANLSVAEQLLKAGIKAVYFDSGEKISHSKYLIRTRGAERVALISSVNIYHGDFNNNHQLSWITTSTPVVDMLINYFKQQVAYDGTAISRFPLDEKTGKRYHKSADGKLVFNKPTAEKRMLRFWRGFKQDNTSLDQFRGRVNSLLIPETIEVGTGRGLQAYAPSFLPDLKPLFVPEEIAIVDYTSEEMYNAIRTTKRGRAYGPLHFAENLFARQNAHGYSSGSVVAQDYKGTVEIKTTGSAYMFGNQNLNSQEGSSVRRTILVADATEAKAIGEYIANAIQISSGLGAQGGVVLVDPKYVIWMFNLPDANASEAKVIQLDLALRQIESNSFQYFESVAVKSQDHMKTSLEPGGAITVKFDNKVKSSAENRAVIIDEIKELSPAPKAHPLKEAKNSLKPTRAAAPAKSCKDILSP
ncbi:MAG: hypothetical protein IPM97_15770 [Bdellovibrionaceae bacterium]|nr:hypothetical protein [Pseudobdellovibrionaceae bacterium]